MNYLKVGDEVIMVDDCYPFYSRGDVGIINKINANHDCAWTYRVKFHDSIDGMWVFNLHISSVRSYLWRFFNIGIES